MINWIYKNFLKPVLFEFDADIVHTMFVKMGVVCGEVPLLKSVINKMYGVPHLNKPIVVDGLHFQGPVLLSAGFDYNAHLSHIL